MEMKEVDNIENLLPLYFEGLLSKEECGIVEQWIAESEYHRKIARQIEMLYLATDTVDVLKKIDTDKALKTVNRRINKKKIIPFIVYLQRAAVILLIPFIVITFWFIMENQNQTTEMVSVLSNPGTITTVTLSDGTVVHLNSDSKLSYPVRFANDSREVNLEGEAFFNVAKDEEKHFIVNLKENSKVEVMGTEFNVESYAEDTDVVTTLVRGKVRFHYYHGSQPRAIDMKPGQQIRLDTRSGLLYNKSTDCLTETCWKDGKIIFNNTRLDDALDILSDRFSVDFAVLDPELEKMSFTGTFHKHRLDQILDCFHLSTGLKWRYRDDSVGDQGKSAIELYR